MPECPKCSFSVSSEASFCSGCGASLGVSSPPGSTRTLYSQGPPRKSTAKIIGYSFLGLMLFSFVLRIVRPDPPVSSVANTAVSAEDTTRPKADLPSHKGLEKTSTVVTAPCASSREVEIEIARAVVNKDEEALEGLIQRQHVPVLEPATKVTVIGTIEGFTEIKVDSGYDIGTFCWVVDTFLK